MSDPARAGQSFGFVGRVALLQYVDHEAESSQKPTNRRLSPAELLGAQRAVLREGKAVGRPHDGLGVIKLAAFSTLRLLTR
jgi:hypothetical protein